MTPQLIATCWTSAGDAAPLRPDESSPVPLRERIDLVARTGWAGIGLVHADLVLARDSIGYAELSRMIRAAGIGLVAILAVLEISLSFDNAVVNATVLRRMNDFWQKIFLSVGIIIAVFGMRLVFPLLLVGITASLNPVDAVKLALEKGPTSTRLVARFGTVQAPRLPSSLGALPFTCP